ncbi:MAG: M48 family metallopeptidase [Porticoccus sp.]|nr:M48 family metallopeptidase [Porticoccus sp.]
MSFAADALTQYIPFEVEHRLVNTIDIDTDADSTGPVPVYLQALADDLSQKMQLPDEMKITVSVVNSDVINAFATLGGNVVFFTGLLDNMPNENTLAMVMAHEIAHIKLRHPLRALGRGVVVGLAVATLAGAGSNSIVDDLIGSTGLLTALSFTRDQESAADELAVAALVSRYGHAEGSTQLFEVLSREYGDSNEPANSLPRTKMPEFFSTHPLSQNRIMAIEVQTRKNNWPIKGNAREIPKSILEEVKRLHEDLQNRKTKAI